MKSEKKNNKNYKFDKEVHKYMSNLIMVLNFVLSHRN